MAPRTLLSAYLRVSFHSVSVGAKVIHDWYQPYFDLIFANPQIKAFCYINWNLGAISTVVRLGDARVQDNSAVPSFFKNQLAAPIFQPATSRAATLKLVHAESLLPAKQSGPGNRRGRFTLQKI